MHAKLFLLCPTLCYPTDFSLPGSSVHGILQARILEWFAMSSSRGFSRLRNWTCVSYISCAGRWVLYHWATGKPSTTLAFHIPCLSSGMLRGHGSVLEQRCWDKEMLRADHSSSTNLQRSENRTLFCVLLVLSTKLLCPCENKFCLPQRLHNSLMVN